MSAALRFPQAPNRPMAQASDPRPLSPFLTVWRWHATMAASILHRVTGVALYAAAIGLVAWLILLASGASAYAFLDNLFHSWFGQLLLYGSFAVLAYHAVNGVRHLVWDTGRHFDPRQANRSAWAAFLSAIVAPILLFAWLAGMGR
jgi:succinate dehydrogenase / fumarate reductase cytochrome b subunit